MSLELTTQDRAALDGTRGHGVALAMRIVTALAKSMDAHRLIDITSAHIDGCLYHGRAGLDFARRLADGGARVTVPTTLNVVLARPAAPRARPPRRATPTTDARALMDAYVEMGVPATWTCAPYQLPERPGVGDQVAWAESNAIVFANSVLGARTDRYGDFIDICCAVTGRAPVAGLHRTRERLARTVSSRLEGMPDRSARRRRRVRRDRPPRRAPTGAPMSLRSSASRPPRPRINSRRSGAAAASSGAVAMFHAVGITPRPRRRRRPQAGRAPWPMSAHRPDRCCGPPATS